MTRSLVPAMAAMILLALPVSAETPGPALRDTAFVSCRDAQAMSEEERKALVLRIADAASRHYQSQVPDGEQPGEQMGWLIRSACTIAPEAYLSTVVARAVRVVGGGIEPPLHQPLDMNEAMFVSCSGAKGLPAEQRWEVGRYIGTEAAAHYRLTPGSGWTSNYVAALVHNACMMYPDAYFLGIVARAVQAMSAYTDPSGQPLSKTP